MLFIFVFCISYLVFFRYRAWQSLGTLVVVVKVVTVLVIVVVEEFVACK